MGAVTVRCIVGGGGAEGSRCVCAAGVGNAAGCPPDTHAGVCAGRCDGSCGTGNPPVLETANSQISIECIAQGANGMSYELTLWRIASVGHGIRGGV